MTTLKIKILEQYKAYRKETEYQLDGDLIVLSGINGSGKSQLLKIIAKHGNEPINRQVVQVNDDGQITNLENILLLSFRDNIDLGNDFGNFSVTYHKNFADQAWEFYSNNIKHTTVRFTNEKRTNKFQDGTLIFNDQGIKNPSWRSISKLTEILKQKFNGEKIFNLTKEELEQALAICFIWLAARESMKK